MRRVTLIVLAQLVATVACADDPSTLGESRRSGTSSGTSGTSSGDTTSSSSGSTGTSGTSAGTTPAEICVATINDYRKTKNLSPYARWSDAETCSDAEAKSDGSGSAAHGAFGRCGEIAQNECPGWPGPASAMIPKCLQAMFGAGPGEGHYEAMMSKQYTKVSCGFGTAQNGQIWSVQNFH